MEVATPPIRLAEPDRPFGVVLAEGLVGDSAERRERRDASAGLVGSALEDIDDRRVEEGA